MGWDDWAVVGRVARPHGLKGQVVINPETDFIEERFAAGSTVWTRSSAGEEQLTVASLRVQNGRPIVGFVGFDRIEDVERLAGQELRVPEEALQPLQPGTFYEHQLVGCVVEATSGNVVGEVAKVEGGAGGSRLVINGPRGEILIPLAVDICIEIDVGWPSRMLCAHVFCQLPWNTNPLLSGKNPGRCRASRGTARRR